MVTWLRPVNIELRLNNLRGNMAGRRKLPVEEHVFLRRCFYTQSYGRLKLSYLAARGYIMTLVVYGWFALLWHIWCNNFLLYLSDALVKFLFRLFLSISIFLWLYLVKISFKNFTFHKIKLVFLKYTKIQFSGYRLLQNRTFKNWDKKSVSKLIPFWRTSLKQTS